MSSTTTCKGKAAAAVRPALLEFGFDAHAGGQPLVLSAQLLSREQARRKGEMVLAGAAARSRRRQDPVYNLATREDHIAPANSVFLGSKFFGGPVKLRAGRLRPYRRRGQSAGQAEVPVLDRRQAGSATLDDWLAKATEHPGSWWPDWLDWIKQQDGDDGAGARARRRQAQADRGRAGKLREGERLITPHERLIV